MYQIKIFSYIGLLLLSPIYLSEFEGKTQMEIRTEKQIKIREKLK